MRCATGAGRQGDRAASAATPSRHSRFAPGAAPPRLAGTRAGWPTAPARWPPTPSQWSGTRARWPTAPAGWPTAGSRWPTAGSRSWSPLVRLRSPGHRCRRSWIQGRWMSGLPSPPPLCG
ncbi:hypothetical protein CA983_23965 [Streptomyces swartbergensis]|uniref:Uncharacterized protein n=1 Tax=Streptomyces swartbergensis TaxID=487165 RepID=A0A243RZT9_9ACTN|nr:hypothetical protein CA983_23965 [Streptomyces swartbergensis]